ncbi:MAG: DUF2059 domain-containing protein [Bacteroidota bacterium]|jgi:hypothetical protein
MKKTFLVITVILITTLTGFTQSKQENIKELLKAMKVEKLMSGAYDAIIPMMKAQMKPSPDMEDSLRTKRMNAMMVKLMDASKEMTKSFMENEMTGIYERNFTDAEIKDLLTFYQSPTGQKMIEKQPTIQGETMQIMMTKYMPAFQEKMKSITTEMIYTQPEEKKN